jgi:formylglycine-generating enzyme required for sulfatase activity
MNMNMIKGKGKIVLAVAVVFFVCLGRVPGAAQESAPVPQQEEARKVVEGADEAQPQEKTEPKSRLSLELKIMIVTLLLGLLGVIFAARGFFQGILEKRGKKKGKRRAEKQYRLALEKELGKMGLPGSLAIENVEVRLDDAFISLSIAETGSRHDREEQYLSAEAVVERAIRGKHRLLLIIGDPGSGKTTLLKYYGLCCLKKEQKKLGFNSEIFPLFLPLRELKMQAQQPALLWQSLAERPETAHLGIEAEDFRSWLNKRKTLVLLDGLDEVSDPKQRHTVCRWIERVLGNLENAFFVVTSRETGYRQKDFIRLECPHLRADIMDFSPRQREEFLMKWFRAAFLSKKSAEDRGEKESKEIQRKQADIRAKKVIDFLKQPDNKSLWELARVPMLLQIMAILWLYRKYLPGTRWELFEAALHYMLDYRDRHRELEPLLPAKKAVLALAPVALWMQETLRQDEAPKTPVHRRMVKILQDMEGQPTPEAFCVNLRDRAGLIDDHGEGHYIFRHKSFREFLAALHMGKEASRSKKRLGTFVRYFADEWWEEPLRFFIGQADAELFDGFMRLFFKLPLSRELDNRQQTLLENLVREAPQRKLDGLIECLENKNLDQRRLRYVLNCLKIVAVPEAAQAIRQADKHDWIEVNRGYAEDIAAGILGITGPGIERAPSGEEPARPPASLRNPFEDNVEYILIPGGSYRYSVTGKEITVPDMYFCKYPVTNRCYRRFIAYLSGKEKRLEELLSKQTFLVKLIEFAGSIKDFFRDSGTDFEKWTVKFRSEYDEDKRFRGEDQPVVAVTWYAARAYGFWLSSLEAARRGDLRDLDVEQIASLYRLPNEWEWEWAAAGREPDGSLRKYPWPKNKGEPGPELANYGRNVGATTPVGRCPEGATPEGLMDMAGNVWEWMENLYREDKDWRALRGGSWLSDEGGLRCSARLYVNPLTRYLYFGFRVVRCQL